MASVTYYQVNWTIEHILLECKRNKISDNLKNQCTMYRLDLNMKSLLGVGCIQGTVFKLIKINNEGKIL